MDQPEMSEDLPVPPELVSPAPESQPEAVLFPEAGDVPASAPPAKSRSYVKTFFLLLALGILGTLLILPFSISLLRQMKTPIPESMMPFVMGFSVVLEGALSVLAIAAGLWLGGRVGLGAPRLRDWVDGDREAGRQIMRSLVPAAAVGLGLGMLFLGTLALRGPTDGDAASKIVLPPVWQNVLGSIGAGIREEIWMRLGAMGFFAWLIAVLTRSKEAGPVTIWTANFIATLLFGAMHLPQLGGLIGFTTGRVVFAMLGNGIPGLVFGWLYWRKGLPAAMVAHVFLDFAIKIILPMVMRS